MFTLYKTSDFLSSIGISTKHDGQHGPISEAHVSFAVTETKYGLTKKISLTFMFIFESNLKFVMPAIHFVRKTFVLN